MTTIVTELAAGIGLDEIAERDTMSIPALAAAFETPTRTAAQLARRYGMRGRGRWWPRLSRQERMHLLRALARAFRRTVPQRLRLPIFGLPLGDPGRARVQRAGVKPRSLGTRGLSPWERRELAVLESELHAEGASTARPRTLGECPPASAPCPHVRCRYHLAIDVRRKAIMVAFPDRGIDQMEETCSLRVANRLETHREQLHDEQIGKLCNLTPEGVRLIERRALLKVRAALEAAEEAATSSRRAS